MQSARGVLPLVRKIVEPKSVVDVGCGVGPWLAVWSEMGISEFTGIDGAYVDKSMLYIPENNFQEADITKPVTIAGHFDLAMSLEVGEHLEDENADVYVKNIAGLTDVVLFSAAAPGQEGTDHRNEQWPEYWVLKFRANGFEVIDCIRPKIWEDDSIAYYYRQNILLFVKKNLIKSSKKYKQLATIYGDQYLPLVHPDSFLNKMNSLKKYKAATEMNKKDIVYTWRWFKAAFVSKVKEKLGIKA